MVAGLVPFGPFSSSLHDHYVFVLFNFMIQCYAAAKPVIMEPVMLVELKFPTEFQGTVTGDINKLVLCIQ